MAASATMRTLTAQVPTALAEQVDALSAALERPRQWIVKKALIAYIARENERRRMIQEGLDDVAAGRVVSMEAMEAWAESETEQAAPLSGRA